MNRRSQPKSGKLNGGKGVTIKDSDVHFPDIEQRIPLDYSGKKAELVITQEYDARSGYFVHLSVELDGAACVEYDYAREVNGGEDDGWTEYGYALFRGAFMANTYQMKLPRPLVKLIEARLEWLAAQEAA